MSPVKSGLFCAIFASATIFCGYGHAEVLVDPTRPADTLATPVPPTSIGAEATASTALSLQSVLISPTRTLAIINDKQVKVGDTVAGARVVAIKNQAVVLQSGNKLQTLTLFGEVPGTPARLTSQTIKKEP